jgi:branched-chain amino acid transport system permease protein
MVEAVIILQQIINGLLFGGQLALVAVGLTLIWGVTRILNFAHGAMFMIGGYAGLLTYTATESLLLAIPASVLAAFILGLLTEILIVRPLRGRENAEFAAIIATFGLAIVLENIVLVSPLGSTHRSLPTLFPGVWQVGPLFLITEQIYLFIIAVVALALLFAIIKYTRLGMAMRAVAQDQDTAELMGVRSDRVYAITFAVSAGLAGLAGSLLAPIFTVYPTVGWQPFLLAFIVVIIGGLGSVQGTLFAALLIGVLESVSITFVSEQTTSILLFVAMIVILTAKPTGFAGVVD